MLSSAIIQSSSDDVGEQSFGAAPLQPQTLVGRVGYRLAPRGLYRKARDLRNSFHNTYSMISRDSALARVGQRALFRRPRLWHVEFHLCDHCNLNCKSCGHFCSIAPEYFLPLDEFCRDARALAANFRQIEEVYLLGGEPLLHPDLPAFIYAARELLPARRLVVLSNGVLAGKMGDKFWEALRATDATLLITAYPLKLARDRIEARANAHGARVEWTETIDRFFLAPLVESGDRDPYESYCACQGYSACPIVRGGALYRCGAAAYADYLRATFGLKGFQLEPEDRLALDTAPTRAQSWRLLNRLLAPAPFCRFCDFSRFHYFDWGRTKRRLSEWTEGPDGETLSC